MPEDSKEIKIAKYASHVTDKIVRNLRISAWNQHWEPKTENMQSWEPALQKFQNRKIKAVSQGSVTNKIARKERGKYEQICEKHAKEASRMRPKDKDFPFTHATELV